MERPYRIVRTDRLPKPIMDCTFSFIIEGPGWPPGVAYIGTSEECGNHMVGGLNMAFKWGYRAGQMSKEPCDYSTVVIGGKQF